MSDLKLSTVRLVDNNKFPWIILIPNRKKITDITELKSKDQVDEIMKFLKDDGKTIVNINLVTTDKHLKFRLKNPRYLNRKSINLLRKREILSTIS